MQKILKNDHNVVLHVNDCIIKILTGPSRSRRLRSELTTRALLQGIVQYIPIIESTPIATTIVTPYRSEALLGIREHEMKTFIDLSIELLRREPVATGFGFGWLGDMSDAHSSLEHFVSAYIGELLQAEPNDELFQRAFDWALSRTQKKTISGHAVLCLGDLSPRNCYINKHGIVLFDFETSVSGAPELEVTRFAINLIMYNKSLLKEALRVLGSLSLNSESAATSCAFNLVRYIAYGRRYGLHTRGLEVALITITSGGSVTQAIKEIYDGAI